MSRDSQRIYDEYLVAAAAGGDRPAWTRLVERWQPRLLRHAWRVCGDAERARDVVQESWIDILRGLRRLDDPAAFPAWACRIVTRRCLRAVPAALHETALPDEVDDAGAPQAPARAGAEFNAELAMVAAALVGLPAPQRAVLGLHYLEGLRVAEIAIALDVPPGTVKTRLMHARRKVRERLEGGSDGQDG